MRKTFNILFTVSLFVAAGRAAIAADLKAGAAAPMFKLQTHEGKAFDLSKQMGRWTVLYFYPKADTPGCTKQACAFRDQLDELKGLGADVFGISVNSVKEQADFHQKNKLNFILLADEKGEITSLYNVKIPLVNMSQRTTFVIDPQLKIADVRKQVDPVKDPSAVMEIIKSKQKRP